MVESFFYLHDSLTLKGFFNQQKDTFFTTEVVKLNSELNFLKDASIQPNAPTKITD
jgi:hypothetical protein